VALRGHSIECRILAENPATFAPSVGKIQAYHPPGGTGVRVDSACYAECYVGSHYDSLVAKVIVRGRTREEAIRRMERALEMFIIDGVQTLLPLHRKILADADFIQGNYEVGFMERYLPRPALVRNAG
jgi:acetyl-CoA carboxylase biotin carboxylase subunit